MSRISVRSAYPFRAYHYYHTEPPSRPRVGSARSAVGLSKEGPCLSSLITKSRIQSIDALQSFLDPATASSARNAYFAVETAHALGLPSAAATQPA